jgi:S-DNA-T family DNA segregation ATPase FtsK/SpoIIIE
MSDDHSGPMPPDRGSEQRDETIVERPVRAILRPPTAVVDLRPPPPAPEAPSASLLTLALPVVGVVVAGLLAVFKHNLGGFGGELPILLAAALAAILSYWHDRNRHRAMIHNREQHYRAYLDEQGARVDALVDRQCTASLTPNPDPEECSRRVRDRRNALWLRSPRDPDFLDLRLGLGTAPSSFTVRPPEPEVGLSASDPLLLEARHLARRVATVDDVAVVLPLAVVGSAGLVGPAGMREDAVRAIVVQLATHHAPTEAKVIAGFSEAQRAEWAWVRWLPNVWNDDRTRRFVADSHDATRTLLADLVRDVSSPEGRDEGAGHGEPARIVLLTDQNLIEGCADLVRRLIADGPSRRLYCLLVAASPRELHRDCGAVVSWATDERGEPSGTIHQLRPTPSETLFRPDFVDATAAEEFARGMAPLRLAFQKAATRAVRSDVAIEVGLDGARRGSRQGAAANRSRRRPKEPATGPDQRSDD